MTASQSSPLMSSSQSEANPSALPSHDATHEPSSPEPATPSSDKGKEKDKSESPTPSNGAQSPSASSDTTPSSPIDADDSSTTSTTIANAPAPPGTFAVGAWQAIYSPQHGTYYFYNAESGETTWVNPLEPQSDPSSSSALPNADQASAAHPGPYDPTTLEARAVAAGIDPSLAHLDPSLSLSDAATPAGTFTAHFNARTGAFSAVNARTPQHLSEYERMRRMSEFYFDVHAWEKEVEERNREDKEGAKKRKRPSKKDLDRFKEQKRLKKIAKTAWLRT